ncbi:hypothetical protein DIC66_18640 [Rhodoferax lacus]|uniref:Cytochrome c domain-containing protein n=1 Tax=Rhodoferax lacus TaxID=2184758 RepID=A0A3E1R851_9BURK|nr:hypothetical protein [Rhodoferax lacus]RFO95381.1 hypothetical protein DIC66_18640 [Rhodoferax lacus]
MRAIHAFAPSANANCQLCHSTEAAAYYSRPNMTIVRAPGNHIAMNGQSCEVCHVGAGSSLQLPVQDGNHFSGSMFSHTGISSGCAACHGPDVNLGAGNFFGIGSIVLMPASGAGTGHIPGFTTCETCHSANTPTGQLSVNAVHAIPGSGFRSPAPTPAMIHAGVSGNCASCHESPYAWLGMGEYARTTSAPYTGFQTRPMIGGGIYSIPDATHPLSGDCSNCHSVGSAFLASAMPGNHIPVATGAACSNCHKAGNFSTVPALVDIHANTPAGSLCADCHSKGKAAQYAMATMTIVSPPNGHIADVANVGCEGCHVGANSSLTLPVQNGAKFANSAFSHSGISSGCASCHGPNVTGSSFYGVSRIVVMPPSGAPGPNSHLPTVTTCESCHNAVPPGLVPAVAPSTAPGSTGFYTLYTPTAAQIHAGAKGGCASCHDTNYVWVGMDKYPISTVAPYTGFQTRPQPGAGGTYFVRDDTPHPVTGECSNCHGSQIDFNVSVVPLNHIPVGSAACAACHKSVDYSQMPSVTDIHAAPTATACAGCHSQAKAAQYNLMASMKPAIVSPPAKHIGMGTLANSCESCHVGVGSSITALPVQDGAKFSGSLFSHSGISTGCDACHGANVNATTFYNILPKTISSLSPSHVPVQAGSACETCHVGSVPAMLVPAPGMTTFAGGQFSHNGINAGCDTCHGPGVSTSAFYGVSQIVMPPTSPPGASSHLPTSTNCESCHSTSPVAGLIPATAPNAPPNSKFMTPVPLASQIHAGVSGSCNTCHDTGMVWMSMGQYPINSSVATPGASYTGFQTRPSLVNSGFNVVYGSHPPTGDCSNCHSNFTAFAAPTKPANHIPTNAACAACHTSPTGDYSVMPSMADIHANTVSTATGCDTCHSDANAAFYNTMASMVPKIVSPPGDHIDMGSLGCEGCHVGAGSSIAATPVPNGAKFSGSLFNHLGATATCSTCHGMLVGAGTFFGVTPKSMGSLSPAHLPVANSTGCDVCHTNSVPTGLVPAAGMKTFAGAQFSHAGITSDCATCHGPTITGSSFFGVSKIIVMPPSSVPGANSHIPSSTTCESCHLGSTPAGLVPGVATASLPGSGFKQPAPTSAMIHNGITSNCSTCHETPNVWMSMDVYPASQVAPYSGFQTRPQKTSFGTYFVKDPLHPATGDCSNCHGNTGSAFTSPSKPNNHIPTAPTSGCASCHTNPDFSVMPTLADIHANAPSTNSGCDQCHSAAAAVTYAMPSMSPALVGVPQKHIDMAGQACETCHVGSNSSLTLPVKNGAKFSNSAYSHAGVTSGCATCHGSTVNSTTFYGVTPKTISSLTPAHVPVKSSMACEVCHTNNIPSMLIPLAGASGGMTTFAGAQFSHSGITTGCAACHGQGVTSSTFYGISKIVVMPPSSTPGAGSHLPTTTVCENCHLGSTPSTLVPGVAVKAAPGSGFLAPTPTASMIHAGTTGNCLTCHETNMVWMSMGQYPITTVAPFKGFQTRPQASAGTFFVKDTTHPATGNCSNCHASMADFTASAVPGNHIPIKTGATCTSCHTNVDFAVMPTIANIHLYAPSSSTNCAQCHSATNAAYYNTMASMNPPIKTVSGTHVDMAGLGCESCHITTGGVTSSMSLPVGNSAKFSNSAYSHTGVTAGCANCHGSTAAIPFDGVTPKAMSGLAPAHIPTSLACEVCHTSVPSGLIALSGGVAPNTFVGGRFSHSGITSGCDTCHGAGVSASSFYGVKALVVLPATTPPGTNAHIPSPVNAQCEACHLGSTPTTLVGVTTVPALGSTLFKTPIPSGDMVHTGVNANCNSCHEKGYSWLGVALYPRTSVFTTGGTYTGFQARPFGGGTGYSINDASHPTGTADCSQCHGSTVNFRVDAKPANHIPVNPVACTACHTATNPLNFGAPVTVTNVHANALSGSTCATCHSVTNAAKYAIPANGFSIKAPDAKHIPFGTTACETCHIGSGSSMTSTTVVDGNKFSGSLYSHSGVTTGCATCHGPSITSTSFTGVSSIVVAPKTAPQGLTSHIPYTAACETCHMGSTPSGLSTVTGSKPVPGSGFRLPKPTGVMIHANSTGFACKACHEANYRWMGVDLYPISPTVVTTGASYTGFQTRPIAAATQYSVADAAHAVGGLATGDCSQCHSGTTAFTAAGLPAGHMPTKGSACSTCHGADYSVATLIKTGIHTGITPGLQTFTAATIGTKTCVTCHTVGTGGISGTAPFTGCATQATCATPPPQNAYQPMLKDAKGPHVPIGNTDCNGCHANFTSFSGMLMKPGSTTPHNNVKLGGVQCQQCHELGMSWFGVLDLKVRVASKHTTANRKAPNDCSNCHDLGGFRALQRPVMREALVSPGADRLRPGILTSRPSRGSLGNSFDHKGVAVGQCKTCHDGKSASGMPARHLMVSSSCDTCHRTTTWTPAQFNHSGVSPNTCQACHNGMGASGKPAGHFMSARSCDSCHKTMNMGWKPVNYQHLSPNYKPSPDMLTCVSCHVTNGEMIPRQMRGLTRTKPIPVAP